MLGGQKCDNLERMNAQLGLVEVVLDIVTILLMPTLRVLRALRGSASLIPSY